MHGIRWLLSRRTTSALDAAWGHLLPPGLPQVQTQSPTPIRMRCWLSCFDLVEVRRIGTKERSDIDRVSVAKVDVTGVHRPNGAFGCRLPVAGCRLRYGSISYHIFLLDFGDGCHRRGLEQRVASLHRRELESKPESECESECERLGPVLKKTSLLRLDE